jgi:hypothetical protein
MQLDLTDDEVRTLRSLLHDYLPSLRLEAARTEARAMRHDLIKRQELCERLVQTLEQTTV